MYFKIKHSNFIYNIIKNAIYDINTKNELMKKNGKYSME